MFICWGACAALYHYYKVPKHATEKKVFGVFEHRVLEPLNPIFRGFDDIFYVPHSRHTEVLKSEIQKVDDLKVLAESKDAGVYMVMTKDGRDLFLTGHAEYNPLTLDNEYKRDLSKGLKIDVPINYYPYDDADFKPVVRWRSTANLMFNNWLNYFVYQATPFNINDIK